MAAQHDAPPHPAEHVSGVKPPQSLEAEREVLAAAFVSTKALSALSQASSQWFAIERHRLVFEAITALVESKTPVDVVTVSQALKDRGDFERAGGVRTLSELLDRAGTSDHVQHYLGILRDKARLRALLEHARRVETAVLQDVDDVGELVHTVSTEWSAVLDQVGRSDGPEVLFQTVGEISAAEGIDWLAEQPQEASSLLKYRGAPFMRDGRVGFLVSPGGMGKSWALADLAVSVASGTHWLGTYEARKGRVLLAFGEEDRDEVRRRIWAVTRKLGDYERAEVARNLVPLGLNGHETAFLRNVDGNVEPTPWFARFKAELERHHWRLVILDPLSRWGGPEVENDAHAATQLVTLLESLTKLPG